MVLRGITTHPIVNKRLKEVELPVSLHRQIQAAVFPKSLVHNKSLFRKENTSWKDITFTPYNTKPWKYKETLYRLELYKINISVSNRRVRGSKQNDYVIII